MINKWTHSMYKTSNFSSAIFRYIYLYWMIFCMI
nr:MAG TPA_asm: hypothetical protein [Caudoviricetes sp.]